jgi:peptidyl-prolyl cis-trans isomerase B (cyclophilin B)
VSSERDNRARAAARARLERQMAQRRETARRRRVLQARIAAGVAGVVVLGAAIWIIAAATGGEETVTPSPSATGYPCVYPESYPQPTAAPTDPSATVDPSTTPAATPAATPTPSPLPEGIQDVGFPIAEPPRSGFQIVTFDTNLGKIEVEMDLSKTPCTANSIAFLANQGFYDHKGGDAPSCHRLVPNIYALQCGDPSATGFGGPNYTFPAENLQQDKLPAYHDGDVAMAHGQSVDTNGSQFFFVYGVSQLPGDYPLFGRVVAGMDIIRQVAAGGYDPATEMSVGGGTPTVKLIFNKVTVGPITPEPTPTPTPSPTPSATPTPTPAAT